MRKEDEEEELEALHLPICQKILSHVGCFGKVIMLFLPAASSGTLHPSSPTFSDN